MNTYFAIKNAKGRYLKIRPLSHQWVKELKCATCGTEAQMQACLDALTKSPYHDGCELVKIGEADSKWRAKLEAVNKQSI